MDGSRRSVPRRIPGEPWRDMGALKEILEPIGVKLLGVKIGIGKWIFKGWRKVETRPEVPFTLRGCLKTCQTSQATDHEMDHGHTDHGFAGLGQILIMNWLRVSLNLSLFVEEQKRAQ
jgi:hypothetical protein